MSTDNRFDTKVAMFHIGRCGSTVLAMTLRQHSEVQWAGEVFGNHLVRPPGISNEEFVTTALDAAPTTDDERVYGFETKYLASQHLGPDRVDMALGEYIEMLRTLGFGRFIVLERKNSLRRLVSSEVARVSGVFHTKTALDEPVVVRIDPGNVWTWTHSSTLLGYFDYVERQTQALTDQLGDSPCLALSYEDDIEADPLVAYSKTVDFLGVAPRKAKVVFERTNPFELSRIIENFADVERELLGTPHEWMLSG